MDLFKIGKVRVPHRKNTENSEPVRILPKTTVNIPMSEHIGAPARPVVKAGDEVFVGTLIGEAVGPVSANIHSSVSGKVKKIEQFLLSSGRNCDSVVIESDGNMTPDPSLKLPEITDLSSLSAAARDMGLVGLGGAGFPTAVKLNPPKISEIDTLIINGAECEPYITSDTRTMLDSAELVYEGVELILDLSGIKNAIIGIENNKICAISKMTEIFEKDTRVKVESLPSRYP